jgi:hypothetical protein
MENLFLFLSLMVLILIKLYKTFFLKYSYNCLDWYDLITCPDRIDLDLNINLNTSLSDKIVSLSPRGKGYYLFSQIIVSLNKITPYTNFF